MGDGVGVSVWDGAAMPDVGRETVGDVLASIVGGLTSLTSEVAGTVALQAVVLKISKMQTSRLFMPAEARHGPAWIYEYLSRAGRLSSQARAIG